LVELQQKTDSNVQKLNTDTAEIKERISEMITIKDDHQSCENRILVNELRLNDQIVKDELQLKERRIIEQNRKLEEQGRQLYEQGNKIDEVLCVLQQIRQSMVNCTNHQCTQHEVDSNSNLAIQADDMSNAAHDSSKEAMLYCKDYRSATSGGQASTHVSEILEQPDLVESNFQLLSQAQVDDQSQVYQSSTKETLLNSADHWRTTSDGKVGTYLLERLEKPDEVNNKYETINDNDNSRCATTVSGTVLSSSFDTTSAGDADAHMSEVVEQPDQDESNSHSPLQDDDQSNASHNSTEEIMRNDTDNCSATSDEDTVVHLPEKLEQPDEDYKNVDESGSSQCARANHETDDSGQLDKTPDNIPVTGQLYHAYDYSGDSDFNVDRSRPELNHVDRYQAKSVVVCHEGNSTNTSKSVAKRRKEQDPHSSFLDHKKTRYIEQIDTPNANDVLCGRGGETNNHPGNIHFRELVNLHKSSFHFAKRKEEKMLISVEVIKTISDLNPPGRFLMKEQDMSKAGTASSYWIEIDDEDAIVKTKKALREKRLRALSTIYTKNCTKNGSSDDANAAKSDLSFLSVLRNTASPSMPLPASPLQRSPPPRPPKHPQR